MQLMLSPTLQQESLGTSAVSPNCIAVRNSECEARKRTLLSTPADTILPLKAYYLYTPTILPVGVEDVDRAVELELVPDCHKLQHRDKTSIYLIHNLNCVAERDIS